MNRDLLILALMVTLGAGVPVARQSAVPDPNGKKPPSFQSVAPDPDGKNSPSFPEGPQVLTDSSGQPFRVVPLKGLRQPWALAFLPNGDILVTEMGGGLRIIRNWVLDSQPISGVPDANTRVWRGGLMDVVVHPHYADNKFIYLTYSKLLPANPGDPTGKPPAMAVALARGRFEGHALTDVKDVFVSEAGCGGACASRIAFARDGTIIMTVGGGRNAQNPASQLGKILRLNDDGTVPKDNPFVGKSDYRPEIYALGIRNAIGLFVHPDTGDIWETEHGPMGGDEINIIKSGHNYGWPVVSYGEDYSGKPTGGSGPQSADRRREGMDEPFFFWHPSPAVGGIVVYTGDKFPDWKGNVFVAMLGAGAHLGARQVQRLVLSPAGLPQRAGVLTMLYELKQRLRDIKQGPDGLLYVTVDATQGAVLRIEPVQGSSK
jgi:glucose/arabinose dehydrogenase